MATNTLDKYLNICVMFKYLFCVRIAKSFDVSSNYTRKNPEFWQHRAYSVLIVDTKNCIHGCVRRQSILEYDRVCMVLNQNSSADWLGLNPAGLTRWEKHYKNVEKP